METNTDHCEMEHRNAQLVRNFYHARAHNQMGAVRAMLADDVVWHEFGNKPGFTGELRGAESVMRMIEKAQSMTGGTLHLEIEDLLANDARAVAIVRWSSEIGDKELSGREVGIYEVRDRCIANVRFFVDDVASVEQFWKTA